MRRLYGAFLACLLVSSPLAAMAGTPDVTVSKAWMRYLLPDIPAGGYMVLHNSGDADAVLTGASSPACGKLMLHKSEDSSGMSMMKDVPNVTVPAHGKASFSPGGYHLMCMQPKMKLGEKVPVTLSFQDGSKVMFTMPVYGPSGAP
ncbi:MAG TPA: copper chaperone PCu(A)C [Acidocella sp.]|nr:copper chaperone PCu(A)C [Acidocella sp.]